MATNPYDSPASRAPGMSSSSKVLLGLGIGCGVLLLLCCGGGGLSLYWFGRSVQDSISKDPAKIREVTAEIVTIQIPEKLPPVMSMSIPIPWVNTTFMTWAQYGDMQEKNMLALIQFGQQFDEQNMNMQWRQSMRSSGRRDLEDVDIEHSETRDVEVNGQPATFQVARGHTQRSKNEVWQVTGSFHGKGGGPAILFMQVNQSDFSEDEINKLLDSMKGEGKRMKDEG